MNRELSTDNKRFCALLRGYRQKKHWNQRYFAGLLNLSIPAYSKIETGITDPTLSRMGQIAHVLDLNIIELIEEDASLELRNEIAALKEELVARNLEIVKLQRNLIQLYDELRVNV